MSGYSPPIRVLVVDDDHAVANSLCEYLIKNGLEATAAPDLATAQQLLSAHTFDVAVFDLMLGRDNSMTLMRQVVARGGRPVIMVSVIQEEADRVLGLELGAADYVGKPFSYRELLARIRTVLRRSETVSPLEPRRVAQFGSWKVDLAARTITSETGELLELTAGERTLLQAFLSHPHRVLTRSAIMRLTGRDDARVFDRAIDVLVARLRHKLERQSGTPAQIHTLRGEGYRFDYDVTWTD